MYNFFYLCSTYLDLMLNIILYTILNKGFIILNLEASNKLMSNTYGSNS